MKIREFLAHATALVVVAILVAAAILKTKQIINLSWFVDSSPTTYWLSFGAIIADLLLAAFLLSGLIRKKAFLLTSLVFAAYAYLNLYFVFSNQNCGCFGEFTPGTFKMLVLDRLIAIVLFAFYTKCELKDKFTNRRTIAFASLLLVGMTTFFTVIYQNRPSQYFAEGTGFGIRTSDSGEIQLLDPKQWIGQEFDLQDAMDLKLSDPTATFVLVSRQCGKCDELLGNIIDEKRTNGIERRIIVVNIDGPSRPLGFGIPTTHLALNKKWICKTPTAIEVVEGQVQKILDVSYLY